MFSNFEPTVSFIEDIVSITGKSVKDLKVTYIPSFTSFDSYERTFISSYGFDIKNIMIFDICFKYDESKLDFLMNSDILILGGGNTFLFRWLLKKFNMFEVIKNFYENGGILVGSSAGSIMMQKSINIANFADEDFVHDENSDGIGIVDFEFKPHFESWEDRSGLFKQFSEVVKNDIYGIYNTDYIHVQNGKIKKLPKKYKHFLNGEEIDG